jgi:carboxylesterase
MDLVRPFTLPAVKSEARAVLLLHGFTGSPYEQHLLAQHLHGQGYHCAVPLLAGHHDSLAALAATRWPDWLSSADAALHELWRKVLAEAGAVRLGVVGLSMGGLLALELARRYPPSGTGEPRPERPEILCLSTMATPLFLQPWQMRAIRRLGRLSERFPALAGLAVPKLFGADLRERNRPQPPLRPRAMPLTGLYSLLDLMELVRGHLPEVKQPALLCHGVRDHTAPYASMAAIAAGLGTPPQALTCLALPQSYHLLPLDVERELVFAAVVEHLGKHLGEDPASPPPGRM